MMTKGLLSSLSPRAKVAVLQASRIGDFICATPAFRALRRALPEAHLILAGLPLIAELARCSHRFTGFFPFPGFPGIAEQFFDARRCLKFFERMQNEKFDLVVQMHGSGIFSNTAALMMGGARTAGFVRSADETGLLDAALPYPRGMHAVHRYLSLTSFLGAETDGTDTEFPNLEEARREADLLLDSAAPYIAIHAGAADQCKKWSLSGFAKVARALGQYSNSAVVLLGTDACVKDNLILQEQIGGRTVNLTGRTSLIQLGAVIAKAALLITTDSAPAHIAYSLGTPSITLFGATSSMEWGPLNRSLHLIVEAEGMENISPGEVQRAGVRLLDSFSQAAAAGAPDTPSRSAP